MRVLVVGAAGMLGGDVERAAEAAGHEPVALGLAHLDITDERAVLSRVLADAPDAVVNCAAYTNVDGAETDPDTALRVNAGGAGHLAAAAAEVGAAVLYLSTDYVFDGTKRAPYVESDATGPQSVYGASKLAGERATAAATPRHWIVRSSWLFGTGGRNFVETMLALGRDRGELRVVDDQVGCPTYTVHLAEALVALIEGERFGVHHVAGAGTCSWYEFAVEILARAGVDCRVEPCSTAEFPRPAPRPAYSVLGTERADARRLPEWREGLAAYLAERGERGAAAA